MNRRELIKRIGQGLGGAVAIAIGVKAEASSNTIDFYPPSPIKVSYTTNNEWRGANLYTQKPDGEWVIVGNEMRVLDENWVVDMFIDDYKKNGRIRQVIQADREWGL